MSPDIRTDHSQNQDRTPKVVDDQFTAQQNSLLSQLAAEQASLQKIQSQGANPFDDSHPDNWLPVYVHAKLMTADDAFMTLGSANVNIRSMNVDSELNICHENSDVTKPLRRKLWGLHTKNQGAQDDVTSAFTGWTMVLGQNKINEDKGLAPFASLVKFARASDSRTYDD
ncbi:putative phospholipase D/Transphosphatidylase [Burkholderia cepacia]|uniref:phospholipase D-like domain-containing protein n=1 Tax=Burkholderia cepacia TaxID=292 RepID=UPI00298F5273|nr:phospholipase D-like domain-containing protein [Burkholderia cepacia]MDW9230411.1 putative phospholipase D/Transphosphatidylase [Burkholderia cepacia]